MHGAVLELGKPHADGTAGGVADVAAQPAVREQPAAEERRGADVE